MKLTANAIKSLKPANKEAEYMDTDYPGFGLRVNPGGTKTYIYRYRIYGKLKRISLGRHPSISLADARQDYREKKELHQQGYDPAQGLLEAFGDVAKACPAQYSPIYTMSCASDLMAPSSNLMVFC